MTVNEQETFCNDEDLHEKNLRDELCRAWSVLDDRGSILWQTLYMNLKYGEKERRWFYDLILRNYFKLRDLSTNNMVFLMTKYLRDAVKKENMENMVDLVKMKEIMALKKVDGLSLSSSIKTASDFADIFGAMAMTKSVWERLYQELVAWKLDEALRSNHRSHRQKYKQRAPKHLHADSSYDADGDHGDHKAQCEDITVFDDLTKISIVRNDIEVSNSEEAMEWKNYRRSLVRVFSFFAGFQAATMRKRELKRFLAICDIKQFWSQHLLMDQKVIALDEFIKYLCNEYVNPSVRSIKEHIQKQPNWTLLLNATKFLEAEDIDGVLEYRHFLRFAQNMSLNQIETDILFKKIDKHNAGKIRIDDVFEWFKKQLLMQHRASRSKHPKHRRKPTSPSKLRQSTSVEFHEID